MKEIYPLTIVADRYSGSYSGGSYTAWNLEPDEVPIEISAGDVPCMKFWDKDPDKKYKIGRGGSIQSAFDDLFNKMHGKK